MTSLLTMSHRHQWSFTGSTGDSAGNRYRCAVCGQSVQVPIELGGHS